MNLPGSCPVPQQSVLSKLGGLESNKSDTVYLQTQSFAITELVLLCHTAFALLCIKGWKDYTAYKDETFGLFSQIVLHQVNNVSVDLIIYGMFCKIALNKAVLGMCDAYG